MSNDSKDDENVPRKVLLSGLKGPIDASQKAIEDEDDLMSTYEDETDCWADTTDAEPLTDIKKFREEWDKIHEKQKEGMPITNERLQTGLNQGWIQKDGEDYYIDMSNHSRWEGTFIAKIYDGRKVYGVSEDE